MSQQLVFSPEQLLADPAVGDPLIAGGMRCHGGFDPDGNYRSPRTQFRVPAIQAWQAQIGAAGGELLDVPRSLIPPQFPNVAQAKLLLQHDIREPIVRTLTMISIIEGFGAVIRDVRVPDLSALVVEPIEGTALAHLDKGLFEAHARDEAGWEEHGGHKQMWEAARDLALENPKVPGDVLMRMTAGRPARRSEPLFPQLDKDLSRMLGTMASVLVIETFAESTFDWGERLLRDAQVSAAPQAAGDMVSHIRADESPHVEYLRTALSELRLRTLRTVDGHSLSGAEVVDRIMHTILSQLTKDRPQQQRKQLEGSLESAMDSVGGASHLREQFESLASQWLPPATTGFERTPAA